MRLAWVDSLRGFLIYLVVLYHVIAATFVGIDLVDSSTLEVISKLITDGLRPVRMPLFFLVSGTLAARAVTRSWGNILHSKVLLFAWVLVLWGPIIGVARYISPDRAGAASTSLLGEVLNGWSGMWFLAALAVYFPLTKLIHSGGRAVRWGSVSVVLVAYLMLIDTPLPFHLNAIVSNFLFFLAGSLVPRYLLHARENKALRISSGLVLFLGAQIVDLLIGTRTSVMLLLASVGATLWIPPLFSIFLNRLNPVSAAGKKTLEIYATHNLTAPLFSCMAIVPFFPITSTWIGVAWIVIMPVLIIAVCMGVRRVTLPIAPWLYELPKPLVRT